MKTKRKVLCLFLALSIVLLMMPATIFADGAASTNYLAINTAKDGTNSTIYVTDKNADDILGDGTVSYDKDSNTLTLKNCNLAPSNAYAPAVYVFTSNQGLNLTLEGSNTINGGQCIYVHGDLRISGDGTLNATGGTYAVMATGNIAIENATVKATTTGSSAGVQSNGGSVTIKNALVDANANGSWGIYGKNAVTIESSTVTAKSSCNDPGWAGLCATNGDIVIKNSNVTAESANDFGITAFNGNVTITDSTVNATSNAPGYIDETYGETGSAGIGGEVITISGGDVTATATGQYANAICGWTSVSITNDAEVTAKTTNSGGWIALWADSSIYVSDSKVTVEAAGSTGISSDAVTIAKADVTASGYYQAVKGAESVTITNSSLDVTSTNDVAIWAPEALSISGSIVNATSPEGNNGVLAQGTEENSISITDSWISTTGDESFDGNIDDSVLFNGITGKVIGDAAVPGDVTIAEEATLTIPEGASLTVPESVTLTNNGTIVKDGSVTVIGTVQCAEGNHVGGTATCKDKAKCELCGEEYGELAQHILVKTEAKPATSSTAGNIAYWTCSVCGKLFSDVDAQNEISQDQTVIPATGGYYPSAPSVQKPTVETSEGVTASLNSTGTTASITVADGYELVDVTVNGVSKGAVTTLTGLKTGDKVVITAKKTEEPPVVDDAALIEAVKNTRLVARSMYAKAPSGKKSIKVYWFNKDGSELNFDGYEVYRSLKKDSGYGTKPIFKTTKARYYNTAIKKGTKYYYKVRAYKVINGEKVYTQYSLKAWRTAK